MTSNAPVSQNKRRALYRNGIFAMIALLLGWVAIARTLGGVAHEIVHLSAVLLLVVMTALTVLWFRALDETARQAHYVAWYWGSNLALAPVMALFIVFMSPNVPFTGMEALIDTFMGASDARAGFLAGMIVTPLLMMVAYSVWWAVHWLRMR